MKAFAQQLRNLIGAADGMRPFLCDGDPMSCTVAMVGANPGTATTFWKHWNDETGMDRGSWLQSYIEIEGKLKRSRKAIETFVPLVSARVIEFNAYAVHSSSVADLPAEHRNYELVHFLLQAVKPRVVVCAGTDATSAVRALAMAWMPFVLEAPHYRFWPHPNAVLATKVNALIGP
jgi:hypothetical protein